MKKIIVKKLNSESGATMIMALLLLLVATITSSIIISSAMSAAMNVKATEKDMQATLSVTSAAEYIKDELAKCTLTRESDEELKYTYTVDDGKSDAEKSAFGPEVLKLIKEIDPQGDTDTYSDEFYITVNADTTKLLPVKVVFEMNKTYDITVHLSISDENYSECKMKMFLFCQLEKYESETKTLHNWKKCDISRESKE